MTSFWISASGPGSVCILVNISVITNIAYMERMGYTQPKRPGSVPGFHDAMSGM